MFVGVITVTNFSRKTQIPSTLLLRFSPGLTIGSDVTDPLLLSVLPDDSRETILVYVGDCSNCSLKSILSWKIVSKEHLQWILVFSSTSATNMEAVAHFERQGASATFIIDAQRQIQKHLGVKFVNQAFHFEGGKLKAKQNSSLDAPGFLTEVVR